MLPEPPDNDFDLSLLNQRIAQVKTSTSAISEQDYVAGQMAEEFFKNQLLPILNVPQIHQMLQNPNFVKELGNVIGTAFRGVYVLGKTSTRKPNIDG